MARELTRDNLEKLIQWEGEVLHAYDDFDPKHRPVRPGQTVRGTLTIGVGHTGPDVFPGQTITREESRAIFRKDLQRFTNAVDRLVKVQLKDNQFAALVSFAFNVGVGAFQKSTLLRRLNAGDYDAVPSELKKYTRSKGKVMQGLVNRRAAEAGLWSKGSFVVSSNVQPDVPGMSGSAKLTGSGGSLAFLGTGGSEVVSTFKEQLEPFGGVEFVQHILLGLTFVGLVLVGMGFWKRWKDST